VKRWAGAGKFPIDDAANVEVVIEKVIPRISKEVPMKEFRLRIKSKKILGSSLKPALKRVADRSLAYVRNL
jgi:hypothetical protein